MRAKSYEDMEQFVAPWTGEQEFAEIVEAIEKRGGQRAPPIPVPWEGVAVAPLEAIKENGESKDITTMQNPSADESATAPSVLGVALGLEVGSAVGGGEAIAVQ